jgi:hypothetical protein
MSITLELKELSPELEKQLASLPEEERGRFAAALMEQGRRFEEDVMVGPPPTSGPIPISWVERDRILALSKAPAREISEGWKKALENHRRLSGDE